ncbi:MAG: ECF-type sigma factor [Vicinamibacterales bacterium]
MAASDPVNVSASALYAELRRLAHHYMRGERAGHILQTTALVNEAYIKLASLHRTVWRDREHFMAMAATAMRRVLVDEARARSREKRGGRVVLTSLDNQDAAAPDSGVDVEALDTALDVLAQLDARQAQIVELRFFAGLTTEETAQALDISPATVGREWTSARAWLHHQLTRP